MLDGCSCLNVQKNHSSKVTLCQTQCERQRHLPTNPPPVLHVQVVSVLPDIHGEDGCAALSNGGHCVGGLLNCQLASLVAHQPGPTRTKLGGTCSRRGKSRASSVSWVGLLHVLCGDASVMFDMVVGMALRDMCHTEYGGLLLFLYVGALLAMCIQV